MNKKELMNSIIEDLSGFMFQLGDGYAYAGHKYPIKIDNKYHYIDILLFNIKYECFVVVEVQPTSLKKEYIDRIQTYMDYIDQNKKLNNHDKTVGLIISKKNKENIINNISNKRIKCVEWRKQNIDDIIRSIIS